MSMLDESRDGEQRRGKRRAAGRGVLFAVLLGLAALAGVAALAGTAALTPRPVAFLAAGWAVFALGAAGVVRLVIRPGRRVRAGLATIVVLSLAGGFALLWHGPVARPPAAPAGTRWASLPTGSRLAYLELPASGQRRHATPVIFLHGGPGVADTAGDAAYLRRLAAAGYDVYLYDQLGVGFSSRLSDPSGYTLARQVADLDAFRRALGARQVDLIGYSWGSTLAAAYLAAHSGQVARVVFVSPGRMVGGTSDANDLLGRLDAAGRWRVLSKLLRPRALLAWTLVQVDPRAAHAYAGDAEMDARFRAIFTATAPALYCDPPKTREHGEAGFYDGYTLQRPSAWRDPHVALRHVRTPALVVKGSCDYLSWASAIDYRDTLPEARLVYLPGAGHRAYAERPDAFFAAVAAFLSGRPLPLPTWTGDAPPPGYQGPTGTR